MSAGLVSDRKIVERLACVAAQAHLVEPEEVLGRKRLAEFVLPRHCVISVLISDLNWSFTRTGKAMRLHHTTALSAYRSIMRRWHHEPECRIVLEAVRGAAAAHVAGLPMVEPPKARFEEVVRQTLGPIVVAGKGSQGDVLLDRAAFQQLIQLHTQAKKLTQEIL
jgi:hypothetical protein